MAFFTGSGFLGLGPKKKPAANVGDTGIVGPNSGTLLAPAPLGGTLLGGPAPPDAKAAAATAVGQAQLAAKKQRRKAAAGASSSVPTPTGTVLTAGFEPKSLLGY